MLVNAFRYEHSRANLHHFPLLPSAVLVTGVGELYVAGADVGEIDTALVLSVVITAY